MLHIISFYVLQIDIITDERDLENSAGRLVLIQNIFPSRNKKR